MTTRLAAASIQETVIDATGLTVIDLGAATTMKVAIVASGSPSLTSFGTVHNCHRYIRFGNPLTLVHNATSLILPGGANIVAAVNDCAEVFSDSSGYWRMWSYQRGATAP